MRQRLQTELPGLHPFAAPLIYDLVLSLSAELILLLNVASSRMRTLLALHNVVPVADALTIVTVVGKVEVDFPPD